MELPELDIRLDDLTGTEVRALLREHLEFAARHSPPESRHALDIDGLRSPDVTFWTAWKDTVLVGCGALRQLDPKHGEVKSMRTVSSHRRQGFGAAILEHLLGVARERGYERLSLETGSMEAFAPARALYARYGFRPCGPYAQYVSDSNSVFMAVEL